MGKKTLDERLTAIEKAFKARFPEAKKASKKAPKKAKA